MAAARPPMSTTFRVTSASLGVWQVGTGIATLVGGRDRSAASRWDDVADLLALLGAPVHYWGLLPLLGGTLVLLGQALAVWGDRLRIPDVGGCRGAMFAGHLAGAAAAWILGVSWIVTVSSDPRLSLAGPVAYGVLLLLSAYCAVRAGRAVRRAARDGHPRCVA